MGLRSYLVFSAAALASGAVAATLSVPSARAPTVQSAAAPPAAQTTHIGEMVPTQGWPWNIFGGDGSQPRRSERLPERQSTGETDEDGVRPRRGSGTSGGTSGTFRTVCVRLCDGFHWPVSHSTTRDRFARDAKQCEQACPNRSRLFVHPASDSEAAAMKDLEGRPYDKLENASRHQREYVADCTCRGNPWDEEALARHRAYAEAAQKEKEKPVAKAGKPAAAQQQASRRERRDRSERWARRNED
jgi:hypothetical protein